MIMLFSPLHPVPSDVPDRKLTSDEEEARRIAEMGKPVLGEHSKLEVIIEESYEFKVGNSSKRQEAGCFFYGWSSFGAATPTLLRYLGCHLDRRSSYALLILAFLEET